MAETAVRELEAAVGQLWQGGQEYERDVSADMYKRWFHLLGFDSAQSCNK